jgi:ATP-binding cassette, subfamily B, bacterial
MESTRMSNSKLCARLLAEGRSYAAHFAAILALNLLATPVELLVPLPLAMVINSVAGANPLPPFLSAIVPEHAWSSSSIVVVAIGLLLVTALLIQLQKLATAALVAYTGERLLLDFRSRLFRHVQRMSVSYHDLRGTADANYRIHWDAASSQWIWVHAFIPLLSSVFLFLGMMYVTLMIDWQLALVALAVAPLLAFITVGASRYLRQGWETTKTLESSAQNVVQEVLTGLRVVKAFGQEDREQGRFVRQSGAGARQRMRLAYIDASFGALLGLTLAAGTALVLFIGGRKVAMGTMTPGDLVLVMAYLAQLYVPIQLITKSITMMQSSLASAARVFALLDEAPDVVEKPHARALVRAKGDISFCNVSFSYDGQGDVLRNMSLEIPRHTRVGIVGTTGAGKTTLTSLLARFHDPTGGQILLDGVDLRDYRLADLRQQFSIVLQDAVLFSASIAENIAYARPTATETEIIEAAKAAHAHEFITALPDGYETLVGERGMRLSGGERQRISLARAFLKDAPILILDEPTSSVDVLTEAAIMEAMEKLMQGRTSLMIAHRMSTLRECDVIFTLEGGSAVAASLESVQKEHAKIKAVPLPL